MKRIAVTCLVVLLTLTGVPPVLAQSGNDLFQQALRKERVDGDLKAAIALYQRILKEQAADRALSAKTLVQLGQAYEKMGNADARNSYQRVIREYADQSEQVTVARVRLGALSAGAAAAANGSTLSTRRVMADADVSGQVSPDGRFLSFTDWVAGGNVAINDLATGRSRLLTSTGSLTGTAGYSAESSVPSPDGKSVAYSWWTKEEFVDLCIVGIDGSNPRVLRPAGDSVQFHWPVAWSPDSKQLLVESVKADGNRNMMLVTVADGSTRLLKALGKGSRPGGPLSSDEPSSRGVFSPDGRYIAWATAEGLSLFELQTGTESALIPDRSKHSVLGWTFDGKYILFSSARTGSADAWLIAVADGKAQGEPLFVKKNWGSYPMGLTRSGAFFYGGDNNDWQVRIAELDPPSGNVVPPPLPASRRGNTGSPDWSPDGRFLAFALRSEPSRTVVVRSMETGEERELHVDDMTLVGGLHWTPDGKAIMVGAFQAGKGDILLVRIDVQTGRPTTLMKLTSAPRFDLHPDGNTLYYVKFPTGSDVNGPRRLVARNLQSGQETEIVEKRGLLWGVVSPDGQRLLLSVHESGSEGPRLILLVMPAAGGEAKELARVDFPKEVPFWGSASWTPDGRYVVFPKGIRIKGKLFPEWQLWRVAAEGGEPQRLGLTITNRLQALRLHPDGRRVAFSDLKVNTEVWAMENFLPTVETPAKARQR